MRLLPQFGRCSFLHHHTRLSLSLSTKSKNVLCCDRLMSMVAFCSFVPCESLRSAVPEMLKPGQISLCSLHTEQSQSGNQSSRTNLR